MTEIADFDDADLWVIKNAVKEHFGQPVDLELAATDLRLGPGSPPLTTCPTAYRTVRGARFASFKVSPGATTPGSFGGCASSTAPVLMNSMT